MPPRYSMRPLPDAPYIPGVSPRDQRPPPTARIAAIDYDALASNDEFRHGIDLFNHGFPWEAHEAWEPLWFAAPRERTERSLLHGLIHAAAAAVKAKAGALDPARNLVRSALEYLALADATILDIEELGTALTVWAHHPEESPPVLLLRE
ncbi:MAG TPA: DUF309 domain-containing protein [Kofleriaceae bacterium]|nr:DUF309 domain-containing protein [Kofleriaceae bacterium]